MSGNFQQAPSPEQLAELLPQYGIESFIAQGGMGSVYKGRQISLDRDVAIKLLLNEFGEDDELLASFSAEAKAMARLNHSNLLGVFDFGDLNGMPYIVMEYVDGGSLHEAAWEQAIEPTQAAIIVKGICDGLAHAHEHNIVHRDIKPSNILLTRNAEPKVADFGLAQSIDSDQPGLVMGTPGYTAPEVFHDPGQAGMSADIYSVGVILHQLLTGIDPAGSMTPPSSSVGNLRLDAMWRKATDIDPARRYPTIAAMSADLEKWLTAKKQTPAAAGAKPYRPPTKPRSSTRGGGKGFAISFVSILLVAAVIVFQLLQRGSQDNKEVSQDKIDLPIVNDIENKTVDKGPDSDAAIETPDPVDADVDDAPAIVDTEMNDRPAIVDADTEDEPDLPEVTEADDNPEDAPDRELPPGDPQLRDRAIGLILDARKRRDSELANNAREFRFQLAVRSRAADSNTKKIIETLKQGITADQAPLIVGDIELNKDLLSDLERATTKESSIDASHRSALTKIRDAYASRLKGAAEESSDEGLKLRLLAQAERAEDLEAWIKLLSPETKPAPGKIYPSFIGNWDHFSDGKKDLWIAYPDCRVELAENPLKGSWKILEDGSLEVEWQNIGIYKYTRDSDGWTGKTASGKDARLNLAH